MNNIILCGVSILLKYSKLHVGNYNIHISRAEYANVNKNLDAMLWLHEHRLCLDSDRSVFARVKTVKTTLNSSDLEQAVNDGGLK